MAQPGNKARVHPSKRHNNPMVYKSGKPRLGPLNLNQLHTLLEKSSTKKMKAKIQRHINRKYKSKVVSISQE